MAAQKTETIFIGVEYESKGRFCEGTFLINSFEEKDTLHVADVF